MKDLTYSYLHYFTVVAEEENVTRAAKRLFISQPALSATMNRLEKALGFQLFERKSNRIVLNEAGRCFLQYVNSAFSIINEGRSKARQVANQNSGSIRIASSMGILRHFCEAYQAEHPENTIDLNVCDTEAVISAVSNGLADFGINFGMIQDSRFVNRVLMEGPYCVAVNREHPLFSRATVSMQELSQYQLFCSNLAHTNEKIHSLFTRARCTCKLLCLDEKDVLFKAAQFGLGGVVCLPMSAQANEATEDIHFIPITGCAETACATIISSRELYRSNELEQVIAYLSERFQENENALLEDVRKRGFSFNRNCHQDF